MAGTIYNSTSNVVIFSGAPTTWDKKLWLRSLLWAGNTGASDDLVVHNYDSSVTLIDTIAGSSGCNLELKFDPPKVVDGLSVSALDAGQLYVYLK
jgi:hypothetical protein